jgi:hypothetical protein
MEDTEYRNCRGCKRGCNSCGSSSSSGGATIDNGVSIVSKTIVPANLRLYNNQRGINVFIIKFPNMPISMIQFQGFSGVLTQTVPALLINLKLDDEPVHSLVNVTALISDGLGQPGILKIGGACSIRLYKMAGYQGGVSNRFAGVNGDKCRFSFREGEELVLQGTSMVWVDKSYRK